MRKKSITASIWVARFSRAIATIDVLPAVSSRARVTTIMDAPQAATPIARLSWCKVHSCFGFFVSDSALGATCNGPALRIG